MKYIKSYKKNLKRKRITLEEDYSLVCLNFSDMFDIFVENESEYFFDGSYVFFHDNSPINYEIDHIILEWCSRETIYDLDKSLDRNEIISLFKKYIK